MELEKRLKNNKENTTWQHNNQLKKWFRRNLSGKSVVSTHTWNTRWWEDEKKRRRNKIFVYGILVGIALSRQTKYLYIY